jgi:hypothetical protein
VISFGIDRLVADAALRAPLAGSARRAAGAPGVGDAALEHSLDALARSLPA